MNKELEKVFTERGFTNIEQMATMFDWYKEEIQRLKEEYIILQNASDEVEEEKDNEIERLKESEEFYKKGFAELYKRIEEALEYLESYNTDFKNCRFGEAPISMRELEDLLDILKGVDKE